MLTSIHEHERRIIGFPGTDYRTPNSTTIHCVIACYVPEHVLLVLNVTEASLCRAHAGTTDERKLDKNSSFFKPPRVFNRGWYILARCYWNVPAPGNIILPCLGFCVSLGLFAPLSSVGCDFFKIGRLVFFKLKNNVTFGM